MTVINTVERPSRLKVAHVLRILSHHFQSTADKVTITLIETMRIVPLAIIAIAVQAKDQPGLRGVSIEEDESFYNRLLEEITSVPPETTPAPSSDAILVTPAPTPCGVEISEDCVPECFQPNPPLGLCPPECIEALDACQDPTTTPVAAPTVTPVMPPTPEPSILPSSAPSPVPTPCKVLTVECPERCWEVDPFDRLPLCTDFNRPDCDTLPFPTDLNCPTCCPTICIDAPELGDCSPTPVPTAPPSEAPSATPTSTATQCVPPPNCPSVCGEPDPPGDLCSPACIACAPTACDVDIQISPNCPSLPCEWDICQQHPFRLEFIYNGGGCSNSEFRRCPGDDPDYCTCEKQVLDEADWPNELTCQDFNGGPPATTQVGATSWIRATPAGLDEIYFEGSVKIGSTFNATSSAPEVAGNIDLFIYEYDAVNDGPGALLQQVLFHSSCSQELFIADTFGANQLIEFESTDALVSLFQTQRFSFALDLEVDSDADELILSTANVVLLSAEFLGPQLQSFDVAGATIPPTFSVQADFTFIPEQNHTAIASVGGILDGSNCNALTTFNFNCPRG